MSGSRPSDGQPVDAFRALAHARTLPRDAAELRDMLGRLVAAHGYRVLGLDFHQRDLARHLGADPEGATPTGVDTGDPPPDPLVVAVPMRLDGRVVGTVRARLPDPPPPAWEDFLEGAASAAAQVASRSALRHALAEARAETELSAERERILGEATGTVRQALDALVAVLARLEDRLGPSSGVERDMASATRLADGARWHLEQAGRAVASAPSRRRGLAAALRALGRRMQHDSGIAVVVDVRGQPVRLRGKAERALYRIAADTLVAVWRHARCSSVHVELDFGAEQVSLSIRDDGVGGAAREKGRTLGPAFESIRQAADEAGASMRLRALHPHGGELSVALPHRNAMRRA